MPVGFNQETRHQFCIQFILTETRNQVLLNFKSECHVLLSVSRLVHDVIICVNLKSVVVKNFVSVRVVPEPWV